MDNYREKFKDKISGNEWGKIPRKIPEKSRNSKLKFMDNYRAKKYPKKIPEK
jgi:hypothetical protein